ncbi:MAG TPA: TetR/AcrR family transcriptional regulator [Ktedonobacteraceae bacterium]|nr:TetR/AcrR family transcriptional regulator [Ktedonobacteraceae bacterium]
MNEHVKGVDPRVRRTRQLLQQALLELMQEKRFASVTVHEIAERATVNRATFYTHFADKYDLLDSVIREQFQREVVSKLPPGSRWGVNTLQMLIGAVFDFLRKVLNEHRPTDIELDPLFERIVQEELAEVLSSWLKQVPISGMGRRVPAGTVASVMSWAMFGAAAQWIHGAKTISAEQMVNQVLIVITEGVGRLIPASELP